MSGVSVPCDISWGEGHGGLGFLGERADQSRWLLHGDGESRGVRMHERESRVRARGDAHQRWDPNQNVHTLIDTLPRSLFRALLWRGVPQT